MRRCVLWRARCGALALDHYELPVAKVRLSVEKYRCLIGKGGDAVIVGRPFGPQNGKRCGSALRNRFRIPQTPFGSVMNFISDDRFLQHL